MPFKSVKIKLSEVQDRRVKLTKEEKSEICLLRYTENLSQRELARMFNVSRRTIQFVLNPASLEENKKRRAERGGWMQYYDCKKHRLSMKNHRRYKQDLLNRGELYDRTDIV